MHICLMCIMHIEHYCLMYLDALTLNNLLCNFMVGMVNNFFHSHVYESKPSGKKVHERTFLVNIALCFYASSL